MQSKSFMWSTETIGGNWESLTTLLFAKSSDIVRLKVSPTSNHFFLVQHGKNLLKGAKIISLSAWFLMVAIHWLVLQSCDLIFFHSYQSHYLSYYLNWLNPIYNTLDLPMPLCTCATLLNVWIQTIHNRLMTKTRYARTDGRADRPSYRDACTN